MVQESLPRVHASLDPCNSWQPASQVVPNDPYLLFIPLCSPHKEKPGEGSGGLCLDWQWAEVCPQVCKWMWEHVLQPQWSRRWQHSQMTAWPQPHERPWARAIKPSHPQIPAHWKWSDNKLCSFKALSSGVVCCTAVDNCNNPAQARPKAKPGRVKESCQEMNHLPEQSFLEEEIISQIS